jgi:iron complex outermembrane receptor protein
MLSTRTRIAVSAMRSALLLGTVMAACPAFAQQARPAAAASSNAEAAVPSAVEEIVVTAQKREQNLQRVPVSVTALTTDTLKVNRIENVKDLSAVAPNLVVRYSGGGSQIPNYTLRGIYTSGTALGTDKGVGLYLDGVYIQNVVGSVLDFADIARIEVLKGPQGTLFGRNATGGAISITTRDPSGIFSGSQEFTYGNYSQFRSKTHLELPKVGPFSAAVTYVHNQRHGDIKNLGAGNQVDYGPATGGALGVLTSPKYLGSHDANAVSAAVKAELSPDIVLVYKFDWAKDHYTPNGQGIAYLPTLPGAPLLNLIYNYSAALNPLTQPSTKRPDAVNNSYTFPGLNKSLGHNFTAKWRVNDDISIKNILAYRKSYTQAFFQLDGLGGLQLPPFLAPFIPGAGGLAGPFDFIVNTSREKDHQWSDELQLNISNQWFNFTAGYLHFHSYQQTEGFANTINVPALITYCGQNTSAATPGVCATGVAQGNAGYRPAEVSVNSDAWFVQPEIHLTHQLDIVGGARITVDHKDGDEPYPIVGGGPDNIIHYRDNGELTFLAGINYRPTNNILTYAKYADGYISGGQLATIQFKPERAYSYEVGAKTEFWNHRIRSNLALFNVNYKSIQYNTSGTLTGIPSSFAYGQAVVPVGDANAKGFEWENTIVPVNGLTLTANVGYTDFKYKKGTLFSGAVNASGAPGYLVQARPKWTGELSGQYETPEVLHGGHLLFRLDANMKGKELLTSDIAPGDGPTAVADPEIKKRATVPMSWLVNGRVALTNIDLGRTKAEIAVWSRNIFNNRNLTQWVQFDLVSSGAGLDVGAIYEEARTFGMDVSISF